MLAGVFPLAQPSDEDVLEPEDLEGDVEIFRNYAGMDEDENVWSQVHEFVEKGFLKAFDSLHECEVYLGGTPVLSRFGQVTKVRFGKLKRRLILDVKQSRVKNGTRKVHRVPLPRATDVVCDIMDMLHRHPLGTDEQLDLLVLDFVDAFWNVPLMASERRFFVGKLRSRYFVFLRAAQGSRNGPLAWAGVVSLAIRLVQACLWRNYLVACLVLLFTALGFPLSFRKGSRGTSVDWIGLNLSVRPRVVHLTITEARVKELRDLAEEALLHNLVSKKWLKSFAGKASSFASILIFWRPFLRSIWTAIYAVTSDGTPRNCVWVKQFVVAVKWILAFLNGVQGNMVRVFDLDVYAGVGPFARMVFDASPWGAGGFLVVDGKFVSWFATKFDDVDEKAIGIRFGDSASQQAAEALAVLLGVRAWLPIWVNGLPILEVKSDSVAAMTMVASMHTRSPQIAVVARELALTFSESCVRPQVVKHTPGVANRLADILSRRFQPGVHFVFPQAFDGVPEVSIRPRTMDFYRSV